MTETLRPTRRVDRPASAGDRVASLVDNVWGVWLATFSLLTFLITPDRLPIYMYEGVDTRATPPSLAPLLALTLLAGLGVAGAAMLFSRYDLRYARTFVFVSLPLLLALPLSVLSTQSLGALIPVVLVYLAFGLAAVNAADQRSQLRIERMMTAFALVNAALLTWVVLDGNFLWGRLQGRIGPNYWGAVAMATFFAAFAIRAGWLRTVVLAVVVGVLVLTQNRTSMIGLSAGALMMCLIATASGNPRRRRRLLAAGFGMIITLGVAWPILADRVLLLSDERRGLGSGGTGRFEAWGETFAIFAGHPWLGVGYRQHERFIESASSAHNAYLAMLADVGVAGFAGYLLLISVALYCAVRRALSTRQLVDIGLAGVIFAYLVQGLFEKRAINVGNSVSLLMIFACAWVMRPSTERARDDLGPSLQTGEVAERS